VTHAPIVIRQALPEDYAEIARIMEAAWREYEGNLGALWKPYVADLADVEGRASNGTVLLAEIDGRVAGTVTYYLPSGGRGPDWRWWPPTYAYLRALGVEPAHRGLGVGRALSLAVVEAARAAGAGGVALNTVDFMASAIALYEALGFQRLRRDTEWEGLAMLSYTFKLDEMEVSER
jgi:GNAT superfamily N-acetyltransferase